MIRRHAAGHGEESSASGAEGTRRVLDFCDLFLCHLDPRVAAVYGDGDSVYNERQRRLLAFADVGRRVRLGIRMMPRSSHGSGK